MIYYFRMLSHFLFVFIFVTEISASTAEKLVAAALEQTQTAVVYDPTYFQIPYPNGDVPKDKGVCTDVIIRAYRKLHIDLQKLVHEDMKKHFHLYPSVWGLKKTDTNIDHRRVPNLQVFFTRKGTKLPVTDNPEDYKPGDIVTWNLKQTGTLPHIGLVVGCSAENPNVPLIVHNIGQGVQCEDMLFSFQITGHYRYLPEGL